MKDNPLVSIIIPFYSHVQWLEESLKSVFSQTYDNFEVILVNDGSTEDVSEVLSRFEGKITYYFQENKGPGAARNLGLTKANGKYVAFEDSDDIWLPNKLEKQVAFMEDRELVWSHTGFIYWWPDRNEEKVINVDREYGDIYLQRQISVKMATPCVIIRRDFLVNHELEFPVQYRNGEDGALWDKLSKLAPVGLIQEPLAKIRMRGTNSYSHAIERFKLGAESYERLKSDSSDIPKGILRIKYIYHLYSLLFTKKGSPFLDFLAKCFWSIPYTIERIYVKRLTRTSNKDEKYIIRCK